ncbi:hypothetical protein V1460_19520 [Streptomyces sp. SCSIO 30461]|uniref:hypothetical protein n=1 Tax=Streptomyces sp. SCSIO 30461 TaxID=3118085 RepID=UPI0030D2A6D9
MAVDLYRFPGTDFIGGLGDGSGAYTGTYTGDFFLPPPEPEQRLPFPLNPADSRRLDLHAALTSAGIAPLPGDLEAIEALCLLDDTTNATLRRWITGTSAR